MSQRQYVCDHSGGWPSVTVVYKARLIIGLPGEGLISYVNHPCHTGLRLSVTYEAFGLVRAVAGVSVPQSVGSDGRRLTHLSKPPALLVPWPMGQRGHPHV